MVYFDYQPLFQYMKKNGITCDSLVTASVVSSGVIRKMKHHQNVETASLCRIADSIQLTSILQMIRLVEVKDNCKEIRIPEIMRYDYYQSKHKIKKPYGKIRTNRKILPCDLKTTNSS